MDSTTVLLHNLIDMLSDLPMKDGHVDFPKVGMNVDIVETPFGTLFLNRTNWRAVQ